MGWSILIVFARITLMVCAAIISDFCLVCCCGRLFSQLFQGFVNDASELNIYMCIYIHCQQKKVAILCSFRMPHFAVRTAVDILFLGTPIK